MQILIETDANRAILAEIRKLQQRHRWVDGKTQSELMKLSLRRSRDDG